MKNQEDIEQIDFSEKLGGKAENLMLLKELELLVPDFLVIQSKQLMSLLPQEDLSGLEDLIGSLGFGANEQKQVEQFIHSIDLNPLLYEQKLNLYVQSSEKFAVRSSNSLEDGVSASWAGIFESYLNVKSENILEAVKQCWCSAYTESSFLYCTMLQKKSFVDLKVNVIVQKMVESQVSGVIFSRNPASGDDYALVEFVKGYGDSLVSGHVNPERLFIPNSYSKSFDNIPFPIEKLIYGLRLAEGKLACDVDIEWAWDGKELYFLQVRPVTA